MQTYIKRFCAYLLCLVEAPTRSTHVAYTCKWLDVHICRSLMFVDINLVCVDWRIHELWNFSIGRGLKDCLLK